MESIDNHDMGAEKACGCCGPCNHDHGVEVGFLEENADSDTAVTPDGLRLKTIGTYANDILGGMDPVHFNLGTQGTYAALLHKSHEGFTV